MCIKVGHLELPPAVFRTERRFDLIAGVSLDGCAWCARFGLTVASNGREVCTWAMLKGSGQYAVKEKPSVAVILLSWSDENLLLFPRRTLSAIVHAEQ